MQVVSSCQLLSGPGGHCCSSWVAFYQTLPCCCGSLLVLVCREDDRVKRIAEEGWDRFAPISDTNKP